MLRSVARRVVNHLMLRRLPGPFVLESARCWVARLPTSASAADAPPSVLTLYEDGVALRQREHAVERVALAEAALVNRSLRSAPGQSAVALYWLERWLAETKGATNVQAEIYTDIADDKLADRTVAFHETMSCGYIVEVECPHTQGRNSAVSRFLREPFEGRVGDR